MTKAMLGLAVALTVGGLMFGFNPVHAQLGNGSAAIGGGGGAIGMTPEASASEVRQGDARAVGQCVTNRTAFRTLTNQISTTSLTFAVMPNTHFQVTHAAGCLVVDFAGLVTAAPANNQMAIRAWIPGIGAAGPSDLGTVFLGRPVAANFFEARSMRFVFPSVPAGTHTVRIDWRSDSDGGGVFVRERTMTVQYRQ